MADDFEYISKTRLLYKNGARHAYLGDVPEPVVYGVQGALRQYYGAPDARSSSTARCIAATISGGRLASALSRRDFSSSLSDMCCLLRDHFGHQRRGRGFAGVDSAR